MGSQAIGELQNVAPRVYVDGLAVKYKCNVVWYSDLIADGIHGVRADGSKVRVFNGGRMWTGGVLMNENASALSTGGIMYDAGRRKFHCSDTCAWAWAWAWAWDVEDDLPLSNRRVLLAPESRWRLHASGSADGCLHRCGSTFTREWALKPVNRIDYVTWTSGSETIEQHIELFSRTFDGEFQGPWTREVHGFPMYLCWEAGIEIACPLPAVTQFTKTLHDRWSDYPQAPWRRKASVKEREIRFRMHARRILGALPSTDPQPRCPLWMN